MPRPRVENKKQVVTVRLAPEMAAEVRRYADNFTAAVEQALGMWLARERRKTAKPDPPHPPSRPIDRPRLTEAKRGETKAAPEMRRSVRAKANAKAAPAALRLRQARRSA